AVGPRQRRGVRADPTPAPRPDLLARPSPGRDLLSYGTRAAGEPILAALVTLDEPSRQQAGERDTQAVLGDVEEGGRTDQGAHRHGAGAERGEEIENEALGGGTLHAPEHYRQAQS